MICLLFFLATAFYMLGRWGRFGRNDLLLMDHSWAPPVFPMGQVVGPSEQRRWFTTRTVSTVLVVLVHIFLFFFFAISVFRYSYATRKPMETVLFLPMSGNDEKARLHLITPDVKEDQAPQATMAPIAIPRPPPPPPDQNDSHNATPGDILGAVGQTLACAAGNFEHLTQVERNGCRREPWRGAKLPSGNIVMVPTSILPRLAEPAQQEFRMSGSDQIQHDVQTGGSPCPILQNTPCLHDVLHPSTDPGVR